jgi:hypothetical protein
VAAFEAADKESCMVGHDLISALQVPARYHDEVRVLRKQCSKRLGVAPIDSLCKIHDDSSDGLFFGFTLCIYRTCQGKCDKGQGCRVIAS